MKQMIDQGGNLEPLEQLKNIKLKLTSNQVVDGKVEQIESNDNTLKNLFDSILDLQHGQVYEFIKNNAKKRTKFLIQVIK